MERIVIALLCAFGVLMVFLGVHGFSMAAWHDYLDGVSWRDYQDGSAQNEVWLGHAQRVRRDDYAVVLPQALSQIAHDPSFPKRNSLVGDGDYNMLVNFAAPVRDITVLFRPQVWGYFLSADSGMAFQWWFNAIGGWLALFFLFKAVACGDRFLSAAGATALLFSPFFQYWSLNCAPTVIFASGVLLFARFLWNATSVRRLAAATFALVWFLTAFSLTFNYTPYLVTMVFLIAFLLPVLISTDRAHGAVLLETNRRLAGVAVALLLLALFAAHFVRENRDVIGVIRDSVYPGHRFSAGGEESLAGIFRGNLITLLRPEQWGPYPNISEAGAFFLFSPLVGLAVVVDWMRGRRRPSGVEIALLGYLGFLLVWNLAGFPEPLARWMGMSRVPATRTMLSLGVADALLLAAYAVRAGPRSRWMVGGLGAAWLLFHAFVAMEHCGSFLAYSRWILALDAVVIAVLGYAMLVKPRWVLPAVAVLSTGITIGFNPVARGGATYLFSHPLSSKILELDRQARGVGGETVWMVYSDEARDCVLPSLFRIIGVKSINGLHTYPQVKLWRTLDPERRSADAWNRYAYVSVGLPLEGTNSSIRLVQANLVRVEMHPQSPAFNDLGVTHVLYTGKHSEAFEPIPNLVKVFEYAGKTLFEVRQSL